MDDEGRTALVAGANGVVGRGIAQALVAAGWRVICASRSGGGDLSGTQGLAVNLLDAADCRRAFARLGDVSHVFYAAYQQAPNRAAEVEPSFRDRQ